MRDSERQPGWAATAERFSSMIYLRCIALAMDEGRLFCDASELAKQSDLAAATNP